MIVQRGKQKIVDVLLTTNQSLLRLARTIFGCIDEPSRLLRSLNPMKTSPHYPRPLHVPHEELYLSMSSSQAYTSYTTPPLLRLASEIVLEFVAVRSG